MLTGLAGRPSPIVTVYVCLATAMWAVTGVHFEDETRSVRARRAVEAAFGDPPDVEARTPLLMGGALMATPLTVVFVVVGMVCGATFGGDPWYRAGMQGIAVCAAWSAIAGMRAGFGRRDWNRWRAAGRPASWRRSVLATPGNRDLVYFVVLAVVFARYVGLSFDVTAV